MIQIEIKVKPLSINKAFIGRRWKTSECKAYEKELWYLLPSYKMITGEYELILEFYLKTYKRSDLSNLIKVLEDIIVKRGYVTDDRKCVALHVYKYPSQVDKINIVINKISHKD